MDIYILDLLVIGLLLLTVTLGSGWIGRLPLSYALIYMVVGIVLSPYGFNLIRARPDTVFLERLTEMVVLISLFSCGLKMNRPLKRWAWNSTIRLIGFLMPMSIFAIAAIGHFFLKLEWGVGILLGAILAPTDPVLASEVQLNNPQDQDELRFGLTSEGGLNDALAFPFVYFGLHWLEDDNWQNWFGRWVAVDLVWAIAAGLLVGIGVAKGVCWLEQHFAKRLAVDELMEDFVGLSTILIAYSVAEIVRGYGFLAVFVAGVVMYNQCLSDERSASRLNFMERLEKLTEIGTILLLGSLLRVEPILKFAVPGLLIAGSLLFVIRPLGAWVSTMGSPVHPATRWLFGWFGIRGVGSLYYLAYALSQGLQDEAGELIAWVTIITVAISVTLHGVTSTPLMRWYEHYIGGRNPIEKELPD
ncbi:cation:proton antiporter [Phormidium tenue]|uniref:Sodium:proton exchanger n=1 Tax=Phormidium tenue NIES-30 TaxID=549789 RepID=A0A1U7J8B4_9CYAN|nr:sodium:proton antiporter [Phormidium tenue]MBD2231336.1 sodium:proton antiporter [Phormidium tenue FACHB-1052]OKH49573.1 sodium:proton exchanger [Phormidium tenue NIES-30]